MYQNISNGRDEKNVLIAFVKVDIFELHFTISWILHCKATI